MLRNETRLENDRPLTPEERSTSAPTFERRDDRGDRRIEERRAHDRYTPSDGIRIDRRQGERRRARA